MADKHVVEKQPGSETVDAIKLLAKSILEQGPKGPLDQLGLSPEAQAALTGRTPPRRYRVVPGVSDSGATMDLVVVEEPGFKHGKVVRWENYKHPAGMLKHISNGGRVPDGMQITKDPTQLTIVENMPEGREVPGSALTTFYKEWRRQTFFLNDHRALIGQELRSHHCSKVGAGLETQWGDLTTTAAA